MDRLASETWRKVEFGDQSGIKFREDSLTEHNLLQLRMVHPQLKVRRFNQSQEKTVGADWEWWVGSPTERWYCLRIQAKRAHGSAYKYLDHPGVKLGSYQYETLIDSCKRTSGMYPFHVFYNGLDWRREGSSGLAKIDAMMGSPYWPTQASRQNHELFGCSALSSHAVHALHNPGGRDRSLVNRYLKVSMPWSQLFQSSGRGSGRSLVDVFHANAYEATVRAVAYSGDDELRAEMLDFGGRTSRQERLPTYAQMVLTEQQDDMEFLPPAPVDTVAVLNLQD